MRSVLIVFPHAGQWAVRRASQPGALVSRSTKAGALYYAKNLAATMTPCKVKVQRPDKTVESEFMFDPPAAAPTATHE
ncbi:MAG: DUF2188 domain-containing protein [Dehalococcoidia bacterium]|nr:DUF2188 domain-containing protein [Dehalococcoidia bacterium]